MRAPRGDPRTGAPTAKVRRVAAALLAGALGIAGLIAIPSPTLAAGSLTMTKFTPASGPVGTAISITGTGFVSGDIVAFNGTPAAASVANKKGTTLKASVPAFATSGTITVTDPKTQQTVSLPKNPIKVTKGIFASPNHVWAGGTFTLSGSALTPDRAESVDLGNANVGKAETDAFGDFSVSIEIPWGTSSGASRVAVVDPLGRSFVPIYVVGSWPAYRHDASRTGVDSYEPTLTPSAVRGLSERWSFRTDSEVESSPAVANGVVYIGSIDGDMYALNASSGALNWAFPTSEGITDSPTVANGVVYFGDDIGNVYAVNASTGSPEWSYATHGAVQSSPAVAGGIVYIGSNDDHLYALDASTGSLVWSFTAGSLVTSSPAVAGGVVYVGSIAGTVYALDALTGTLEWSNAVGSSVGTPALAGGLLYIGSGNGKVYALDATTGARVWSYGTGDSIAGSDPAVSDGEVFIGSINGKVYALNATTGALSWTRPTGRSVEDSPAVANGVVYVGSINDNVYALNATTGVVLWSFATGFYVESSPAVADGIVYVGSLDFKVYAFSL